MADFTAESTPARTPTTQGANLRVLTQTESAPLGNDTLFCIDSAPNALQTQDARRWLLPCPALRPAHGEHWHMQGLPARSGWQQGIGYSDNGSWLFAHLRLPAGDARAASAEAYHALRTFVTARGYSHWLRTWNYLGAFNEGAGDAERYRQFCVGRAEALAGHTQHPAATAIGIDGEALHVAVLAAHTPGQALENPRQTAAWRYPRDYGPQSPSFSRGMVTGQGDAARLLLSGTASVVGHETLHAGDAHRQLPALMENVRALLAHAADGKASWQAESLRLYIRREQDADALCAAFAPLAGNTPWLALRGDISRRDLMVEVEGVFRRTATEHSP